MFLISGPGLLYVFKKWSEFTLKVVRVYLKSGPSLPGPSLLVFNRTTRIIFNLKNTDYTNSITNLRKSLNWLPTIDNINIKLLTILYKTTKTTQPHNLHTLLHKQTTNRQLRQTYRLDIPTTRLRKYSNKRFSWRGATLWNKLPQSIRKEDISITTFKYKLKELFKRSPLKYHISNPL